MNHSIYSADRSTHLKIVVVALVAGIVVAGLGISFQRGDHKAVIRCESARSKNHFWQKDMNYFI